MVTIGWACFIAFASFCAGALAYGTIIIQRPKKKQKIVPFPSWEIGARMVQDNANKFYGRRTTTR